MKPTKGLTFWIVFGSFGGFWCHFGRDYWRVSLGWVALMALPMDIENALTDSLQLAAPSGQEGQDA